MEAILDNLFSRGDSIYEGSDDYCSLKGFPYNLVDPRRLAIKEAHNLEQKVLGITGLDRILITVPVVRYHKQDLPYYLKSLEDDSVTIPPQIEKAIKDSRFILKLSENWDGEGSPKYSEETWNGATQFIRKIVFQFKKETDKFIETPKLTPSHDGSIDVRWKSMELSLLINFPADLNSPASFFGSDRNANTIKGTFNSHSQNLWLLKWLIR